jgi:hypothetical protein
MAAPASPPPTTVQALLPASAWATARVPSAYADSSNTPRGHSRNRIGPDDAGGEQSGRLRADVQAHPVRQDRVDRHHLVWRVRGRFGGHDDIGRKHDLGARSCRLIRIACDDVDLAFL